MKKRVVSILIVFLLTLPLLPAAAAGRVMVSRQSLRVDGKEIACQKYNIDDRNYFMLRDLAMLLSGSGSQFSVRWDEEKKCVVIVTGEAYTPDGSELDMTLGDQSATAVSSSQSIYIDGELRTDLTVYNIGGHNYFQLKELGAALGFFVDYDQPSNTAIIIARAFSEPTPWTVQEETVVDEKGQGGFHTVSTFDASGRLLSRREETAWSVLTETRTYDELGRTIEEVRLSEDRETGELLYRESFTWEYDRWGNLTKETTDDGDARTELVYTYDDRGNLIRKWQGDTGSEFAYDERGNLIRQTTVSADGFLIVTAYERDEAGHVLEERTLKDGKETSSAAYTWEGDLCLRQVETNAGGETVREYTYDEAGNLIRTETIFPERTEWETFSYDEAGRLLRREYRGGVYDWGEAYTLYTCRYDDAGHPLQETYAASGGDTWTAEYAYNEDGDPVRIYRTEWTVHISETVISETVITYDADAGKKTSVTTRSLAPADRLVFPETELTLEVGQTYDLGFYFEPQGAYAPLLTWTSSDPSVVTAEDFGKLTALAPGEAIVTAASASGLTASCKVTVE